MLRSTDVPAMLRSGEFTIVAITDDKIAEFPAEFAKLESDPKMKRLYMMTTIFRGTVTPEQLRSYVNLTSLAGQEQRSGVSRDQEKAIYLGSFNLALPPITASNGIIYAMR